MPAAIAIPLALGAGSAAAGVIGAKIQSGAAKDAAKLSTDAANHGADVQDAAAQRAETFQRQQAEQQWQAAQLTQRANYDQAKARFGTIAGVASQYGLNPTMPDYVAGIDPHYDQPNGAAVPSPSAPAAGTIAGASGAPAIDPSKGDIGQQVSAYFKSRGVSDAETPYWVSKWSEFGAKDPAYFNQRLSQADIFGGGAAPKAPTASYGSIAALSAPSAPAINTAIPTPYTPGSIAGLRRY